MANRTRNISVQIYLTEAERALIAEKMQRIPQRTFQRMPERCSLTDRSSRSTTRTSRRRQPRYKKIGVNVNQIAKRLNAGGDIYAQDIEDIKGALAEIWRLQRLSLLKAR